MMKELMPGSGGLGNTQTVIYDYCVVGGGILGLATAMRLLDRRPGASLVLVEKEAGLARHQTGHNSGVIHAGVYYAPGSLKARLCSAGAVATKQFCRQNNIPFRVCGKLIVATSPAEMQGMLALEQRALTNGIKVERLDRAGLKAAEPHIEGLGALHLPSSAIVDFQRVADAFGARIIATGGEIRLSEAVLAIIGEPTVMRVETARGVIMARMLVTCAGLQSDRIARMAGLDVTHQIVPFRGEFFRLAKHHEGRIQHLIYPVPDPALPFLGIHLTPRIDESLIVGPNAVLGLSRERKAKWSPDLKDIGTMLSFGGFWRMAAMHWRSGLSEFHDSINRRGYLAACRKYYPDLRLEDLEPHPPAIRAQAVGSDGRFLDDFLFLESERALHVCNAPSPAATSALPIAAHIVARIEAKEAGAF